MEINRKTPKLGKVRYLLKMKFHKLFNLSYFTGFVKSRANKYDRMVQMTSPFPSECKIEAKKSRKSSKNSRTNAIPSSSNSDDGLENSSDTIVLPNFNINSYDEEFWSKHGVVYSATPYIPRNYDKNQITENIPKKNNDFFFNRFNNFNRKPTCIPKSVQQVSESQRELSQNKRIKHPDVVGILSEDTESRQNLEANITEVPAPTGTIILSIPEDAENPQNLVTNRTKVIRNFIKSGDSKQTQPKDNQFVLNKDYDKQIFKCLKSKTKSTDLKKEDGQIDLNPRENINVIKKISRAWKRKKEKKNHKALQDVLIEYDKPKDLLDLNEALADSLNKTHETIDHIDHGCFSPGIFKKRKFFQSKSSKEPSSKSRWFI